MTTEAVASEGARPRRQAAPGQSGNQPCHENTSTAGGGGAVAGLRLQSLYPCPHPSQDAAGMRQRREADASRQRDSGQSWCPSEKLFPGAGVYTDPGVLDLDMRQIFYREWLFAIPACEIPKAGNFVTHQVGSYTSSSCVAPMARCAPSTTPAATAARLSARPRRAMRPSWSAPTTSGPMSWTFRCCGRVTWGRISMPPRHGLKRVHCRDLAGLIYICLADEAPDFDTFAMWPAPIWSRTIWAMPRWPMKARSSRTATGSWSGRTTASAITAAATTLAVPDLP